MYYAGSHTLSHGAGGSGKIGERVGGGGGGGGGGGVGRPGGLGMVC